MLTGEHDETAWERGCECQACGEKRADAARVYQTIKDKAEGKPMPPLAGPGEDGYGGSALYKLLKKDGLEVANVDVETGDVTMRGVEDASASVAGASRQVRRAEERASTKQSAALTKMAENAERVVLGEEQAQKMQRMRIMLFALVKQLGRVRLTQAELNAIAPKDGLDVKVQPDGSLVITYLRGRDR